MTNSEEKLIYLIKIKINSMKQKINKFHRELQKYKWIIYNLMIQMSLFLNLIVIGKIAKIYWASIIILYQYLNN